MEAASATFLCLSFFPRATADLAIEFEVKKSFRSQGVTVLRSDECLDITQNCGHSGWDNNDDDMMLLEC
eukprot:scaffold1767_cov178-Ochromonas_danica.AAC.18